MYLPVLSTPAAATGFDGCLGRVMNLPLPESQACCYRLQELRWSAQVLQTYYSGANVY